MRQWWYYETAMLHELFMLLLRSKGVRQNYEIQTTSSLTTLLQTTNVKKCKVVTNVVSSLV